MLLNRREASRPKWSGNWLHDSAIASGRQRKDRTKIAYLLPMVNLDTTSADNVRSAIGRQISRQERRQLERESMKMTQWIDRHCKNLIRPIGKPAKLDP